MVLVTEKYHLSLRKKLITRLLKPAILYATECWAVNNKQENKLKIVEMKVMRWISRNTRQDKIRNASMLNLELARLEQTISHYYYFVFLVAKLLLL